MNTLNEAWDSIVFISGKANGMNASYKDPRNIDFQSLHESWDPFEDRHGFMSVPSHLK